MPRITIKEIRYLIVFCCVCFLLLSVNSCCGSFYRTEAEKLRIEQKYQRLRNLIRVGMDIDEAADILKENSFKVGKKHSPTGSENYFVVHIKLRERIPPSSTIAEILGTKSKNGRAYAVLEAGGDNKIFRIQ
ncbi:MAG: hypothetical protein GY749_36075 [Desulfobacteraceae bacterium]|nr:hypothetical protein [Desulfobacteraceae bacterium]